MATNPKTHREINNIISDQLKKRLDDYLETRSAIGFLSELPTFLEATQHPQSAIPGQKYSISTVNAVVMYVGVRAIDSIHEKNQRISMDTIAHTAFMDIFQNLAVSLCTEGRPMVLFMLVTKCCCFLQENTFSSMPLPTNCAIRTVFLY